jgi:thiol-disulfide isomerase/thioredoxin
MGLEEIKSDRAYKEFREAEEVVLVAMAEWCGPCRDFRHVLEQAAAKYPDIRFGTVDIDLRLRRFRVDFLGGPYATPETILFSRKGGVLRTFTGQVRLPRLERRLRKYFDLPSKP